MDYDEEGPSRQEQQELLYDVIGFLDAPYDETAHTLFYDAMYNDDLTIEQRMEMFEELEEYLYDTYDIYFVDVWDWEDFREWYRLQQ